MLPFRRDADQHPFRADKFQSGFQVTTDHHDIRPVVVIRRGKGTDGMGRPAGDRTHIIANADLFRRLRLVLRDARQFVAAGHGGYDLVRKKSARH